MSSRRKSHPVVTLFAFQDVIMSVSGIIIVVVLLLSLELVQRPEHTAAPDTGQIADQLRRSIEEALILEAGLEKSVQTTSQQIQSSATMSSAELVRQTSLTVEDNEQLAVEVAVLEAQVEALKSREQRVRIQAFEQQHAHEELESAQRKAEDLDKQVAEERHDNRPVFGSSD